MKQKPQLADDVQQLMRLPAYSDPAHIDHKQVSELVKEYFDHDYPALEDGEEEAD